MSLTMCTCTAAACGCRISLPGSSLQGPVPSGRCVWGVGSAAQAGSRGYSYEGCCCMGFLVTYFIIFLFPRLIAFFRVYEQLLFIPEI